MDSDLNWFLKSREDGHTKELLHKVLSTLTMLKIGLWEYDIVTKKLSFLNDFLKILSLDQIGITYSKFQYVDDFVHPDDLPTFNSAFSSVVSFGSDISQIRYRLVGTRGEVRWLEDSFFPFQKDAQGAAEKIIGYTINADVQQKMDEEIKKRENRYEKIIKASPGFVFIFDDQFFLQDVFIAEGTELLHSLKELIGIDARTIYSPEVSELYIHNIRACLADGQLREIEYCLDKNGVRYYFQARIIPYEGNRVLALIYDIGDKVRRIDELIEAKSRAEESDRMKSAFLANMSHEIRTPLNAIVGFSEIISVDENPENREEYVEIIRANSNLLLQLINDVLDISRIESGKSEVNVQNADVNNLLDEIEQVYRVKMKPGVELIVIHPEGKLLVATDPNRVQQILYNFLSNAKKNTEKGSITLRLDVTEGDTVTFSVTDTGCGIESSKLKTIFDRFEKVNSFVQGTGLGLSISKGLVELLGGSIKVTSVYGEGSTFSFVLPFKPVAENNIPVGKRKILVAEPIDADYEFIVSALGIDYELFRSVNGQETVELFISGKPDMILMNIPMPVMNGIEATKKIRAISATVPIVAVTAHSYYTDQQLALEAGCNDLVSKPYSATNLREAIVAHL